MGILDYFKPAKTVTVDEVRKFIEDLDPAGYNLVDVRQPGEYERRHLPGSRLIPVGEISERYSELDPMKPTIAY